MEYLKLKLESLDYPISRTVVLPDRCSLAFLHEVIQAVFRWRNYHLYQFTDAKGLVYADPLDEGDGFGDPPLNAADYPLSRFFPKRGTTLDYLYDFGDGNEIKITFLQKVKVPLRPHFEAHGPNMVEDSGGLGGVGGIWSVLRAGRKNKDYEGVVAWLWNTWHLVPEQALHEPTGEEIYAKVFQLVKIANLFVRSDESCRPCWEDYLKES